MEKHYTDYKGRSFPGTWEEVKSMDPNKALFEILENAPVFWNPSTPKDTRLSLAEHIIENAEALAEWLTKQGYVPEEK